MRQFRSPLIYILGVAAVVSLFIGEFVDAGFIVGVLVVNALVGGVQEWRADRSTRALQKLLRIRASVLRDAQVSEIDADQVVPGDVVYLESGGRVPADLRLVSGHGLEIDESLLTGESVAVVKNPTWQGQATAPLAERLNMAYAGSAVTRGRAKGVVVATGASTHVGHLALDVMSAESGQPPLIMRLERFTKVIGVAVLIAALVIVVGGVVVQRQAVSTMFLFGTALAVSAIPEGLPVAITVALTVGTIRMVRRGVIVRKLSAVEGLGSCTLIASDKTGTLTCNEMTVKRVWLADGSMLEVSGEGFAPTGEVTQDGQPVDASRSPTLEQLGHAAALCNEADLHRCDGQWTWRGDPTEVALLTLGAKLGLSRESLLDRRPQVNEIPFESEHQFAASYHRVNGSTQIYVKGSPERVLSMCAQSPAGPSLDDARLAANTMAGDGYRVLALASASQTTPLEPAQAPPTPSRLTLLGLVGMIDPLRPGVQDAIAACHQAGIRVCMVTGDHPQTASAIGRNLGLDREKVITGSELEGASDSAMTRMVTEASVFARVSPHQKLRLVEAAQRGGAFVAVTGDGVNDAPALHKANIGVAMGRGGTDVAREAADIVISDDNFATIVAGIEEGRVAYSNIRNVIFLLVSTGAAEVVMVLLAVLFGLPLPLEPVQLLWLNLVTNGIQHVGLALEPASGRELLSPPRHPQEPIFNRLMIERTVIAAVVMGAVAFAAFYWMLHHGWEEASARNALLLLMVLFENVHIGNCRSETRSVFSLSPLRSPFLLAGAATAFLVHVAAMYLPITQNILAAGPISWRSWFALMGLSLSVLVVVEAHKWLRSVYARHR